MKRTVPITILLLALSLFFLTGAALADSRAVFGFPNLPIGDLNSDLYLYSCTDATCKSVTQVSDYGHITNVPRWPKGSGGPGGPVPQSWAFVTVPEQGYKYYQFWQQKPGDSNCWQSCIVGITAKGELDNVNTTCAGTVTSGAPTVTNGVPEFTFGAAMFAQAACGTPPSKRSDTNTVQARSITFVNDSSAQTLCLQTDSSFEHTDCTGANKVTPQSPYVISSTDLADGKNSGLGQVSGIQMTDQSDWINTGNKTQVYSTNLEYTIWPQQTQYTMGPTTIDISLVNGFNVGATLTADRDCVCSISDKEGATPYFVLYRAGDTLAVFPEPQSSAYSDLCPQGNEVLVSESAFNGCYSACSKAQIDSADVNQMCCRGDYNSPSACTAPPGTDYVQYTNSHSTRVYTWAYNDFRGTFTCEPTASFTFTITDSNQ
jgi:hypothetical protein